ncbi:MAG: hypothetical protein K5663_11385 [Clostridiales bacterium]|nr:hypothetical protein [Clostridiales bacterium]
MYLTLEEYEALTGEVFEDNTLYGRLEYRARKRVDDATFGRLKADDPVREAVKRLMAELIGVYSSEGETAAGSGIASTSNDGVSVSYVSPEQADKARAAREKDLIRLYLEDEKTPDGYSVLSRWAYADLS